MSFIPNLSQHRKALGLTQSELAAQSGVSLPNLQKIESGNANPSVKTLEKLFSVLGLSFAVTTQPIDWTHLAAMGVPITVSSVEVKVRDAESLVKALRPAISNRDRLQARERKAIAATLFALKLHYPKVFHRLTQQIPIADRFLQAEQCPELIKLKRIALAKMAEYL